MENKKIILIISGIILVTIMALSFALLSNSKQTNKLSNKCNDNFCNQKDQINHNPYSEDDKTVKTVGNRFGVNDSPFGILTALYPPKRIEKMYRPTEYHWNFSKNDNPPFSTVKDLGLSWDRGTAPILDWSHVQKNIDMIVNNKFDWRVSDNYIKQMPSNMNFIITLTAGTFAIPSGQWRFKNKKLENAYAIFVQKAVERYDGDGIDDMPGLKTKVKYWQIENEPAAHINRNSKTKFSGSIPPNFDYRGYADLLKIAYNSIKTADPNAHVLSAGMVSQQEPRDTEIFNGFWTPLIKELNGNYIDIFDFHWFEDWDKIGDKYDKIRALLNENGFQNTDIWMTENGRSSEYGKNNENGEQFQASDLIKRLFFPLTLGVKKTFWAWALVEGFPPFNCQSKFDYTGLIYDGYCPGDLGYGVKKLSYYSFKLLNKKVKSLDLENIKKIAESDDIYVYKITNKETGKPIWIAWSDSESGSVPLSSLGITNAKITEAVPNYDNGRQIQDSNVGFDDMFKKYTTSDSVKLSDGPVYIEM